MASWNETKLKRTKQFTESYLMSFFRFFSLPVTWLLSKTSVSPNLVTLLGFICYIVAGILLILNRPIFTLIAGLVIATGFVLDLVDGELSRVKEKNSKIGAWLDGVFDRIGDVVILGSMGYNLFLNKPSPEVVVLALFAIISTTLWRLLALQTIQVFEKPHQQKDMKPIGFDVAMQNFILALGAIVNQLMVVLIFYAVVINGVWIKNVVTTFWKERRATNTDSVPPKDI